MLVVGQRKVSHIISAWGLVYTYGRVGIIDTDSRCVTCPGGQQPLTPDGEMCVMGGRTSV